ncbi:hypothetical protein NHX12_020231 [Muraenolepis orangiensis]|uniref:Uncharacterized protein n=1 Tax=Muraenolepis orangiensis TaxID=630683 RepID=A0A9Q0IWH0_9TELE|nr:hypothetical protein NHX12_020231 [Muraenolepis orangiensis]
MEPNLRTRSSGTTQLSGPHGTKPQNQILRDHAALRSTWNQTSEPDPQGPHSSQVHMEPNIRTRSSGTTQLSGPHGTKPQNQILRDHAALRSTWNQTSEPDPQGPRSSQVHMEPNLRTRSSGTTQLSGPHGTKHQNQILRDHAALRSTWNQTSEPDPQGPRSSQVHMEPNSEPILRDTQLSGPHGTKHQNQILRDHAALRTKGAGPIKRGLRKRRYLGKTLTTPIPLVCVCSGRRRRTQLGEGGREGERRGERGGETGERVGETGGERGRDGGETGERRGRGWGSQEDGGSVPPRRSLIEKWLRGWWGAALSTVK